MIFNRVLFKSTFCPRQIRPILLIILTQFFPRRLGEQEGSFSRMEQEEEEE